MSTQSGQAQPPPRLLGDVTGLDDNFKPAILVRTGWRLFLLLYAVTLVQFQNERLFGRFETKAGLEALSESYRKQIGA